MPFDVIGWSEAAPGTGTVGIARPAGDTLYPAGAGDNLTLKKIAGKDPICIGVMYLAESTPGYCRVRQASMDWYHEFIRAADLNTSSRPGIYNLGFNRKQGFPMYADEDATVYSNNATDEDTIIGLALADGFLGEPATPDFYMRGTVDQTITANTWTQGTVVWSQTLKGGAKQEYAVVSLAVARYLSTSGGGLARLTGLKGNHRPGVPLMYAAGDKIDIMTEDDPMEFWGAWPVMEGVSFTANAMPNLEFLSPIANTDFAVEMGVKKI